MPLFFPSAESALVFTYGVIRMGISTVHLCFYVMGRLAMRMVVPAVPK
ncbi:hypothetical protein [Bacillus cereus]|nr:hypothetical protein [Bacillus cereus]